jgi:thiamine pyrophosphate-dependent acetolactate synthase large subunit-like protein
MGAGIPMAMGAKLAAPERIVVVVCGDFGFGLSAMDLETAVRHRIPVVVVVANNDGICGGLRQKDLLPREHPELFSRFQEALRYERIAEIFGGHSEFVTDATVLRDALDRAAASGLPACVNVRVDPYAPHPGFW